jgi:hypothetical protein
MAFAAYIASGPVTVKAVPATGTIAVKFGSVELNVTPEEWADISMQGSSAALELRASRIRTGMRIGPLQRGNADLVEVPA